jgi:hypothetical protein
MNNVARKRAYPLLRTVKKTTDRNTLTFREKLARRNVVEPGSGSRKKRTNEVNMEKVKRARPDGIERLITKINKPTKKNSTVRKNTNALFIVNKNTDLSNLTKNNKVFRNHIELLTRSGFISPNDPTFRNNVRNELVELKSKNHPRLQSDLFLNKLIYDMQKKHNSSSKAISLTQRYTMPKTQSLLEKRRKALKMKTKKKTVYKQPVFSSHKTLRLDISTSNNNNKNHIIGKPVKKKMTAAQEKAADKKKEKATDKKKEKAKKQKSDANKVSKKLAAKKVVDKALKQARKQTKMLEMFSSMP